MDSERGGVGISAFILPDGVVCVEDEVSLLDSMLRRGVVPSNVWLLLLLLSLLFMEARDDDDSLLRRSMKV